ncbi:MAG: NAD(P)H-dependent glycerol-3-phosphate dehydrogenase [Chlorobi bacterium]|nr:NAD(P)H-dependent glycerol-3-phosphate dehydrogenase [Chlorobiota bacterium]
MNITVLGAGSWGTTLAAILANLGHTVTLWGFVPEDIREIQETGKNSRYLPDLVLPEKLALSTDLETVLPDRQMVVLATPAQYLRGILEQIPRGHFQNMVVVNVAKGIEKGTLFRMSEMVIDMRDDITLDRYACLSGPSHAEEVSREVPTTVVAASSSEETALAVQRAFMTDYFRIYTSNDLTGVELGGALKNVIAIGAGICNGVGFGDNTLAALITRGIAEMRRLGVALGARPDTFAGLSGLGDLIVTCMSRHSRNRYVGEQIGKGKKLRDIVNDMTMVAEGVETTRSVFELAQRTGVEMPISHKVHEILFEDKEPFLATRELMTREARVENWG